ncbi:MAG: chorismate synthase [Desulfuromonadales bacterium]|jgi:chorismate synthase|nr:chorismate synthase [Desulfuromonadales bacterium]
MNRLRYLTAGESHGPSLTAIIEGMPANLELDEGCINRDLGRRQQGYGRGGRMSIEKDRVNFLSGVRWGKTLGSPITLSIRNRDWENWDKRMSPLAEDFVEDIAITHPRPGHADLTGVIKYRQDDARNVLERSSARETAARVAIGALCKRFLDDLGISVLGYVAELGGVAADAALEDYRERFALSEESPCRTFDAEAEQRMIEAIDQAKENGDALGGVVEVAVLGAPIGLGSYAQWDRRLDGRLAYAMMSIQAFKGVEVGLGFEAARRPGSQVHDEIFHQGGEFFRKTNRAGGLEGGMTNGAPVVVRGAMKPIPTLYQPLQTVDFRSKSPYAAVVERSDVCAVPAAAVVAEAVVAIELAQAMLEKFGGDAMEEIKHNLQAYRHYVRGI